MVCGVGVSIGSLLTCMVLHGYFSASYVFLCWPLVVCLFWKLVASGSTCVIVGDCGFGIIFTFGITVTGSFFSRRSFCGR